MKAKRVKGVKFICGCASTFILPKIFDDIRETEEQRNKENGRDVRAVDCINCGAKYEFEEICRYTVTPVKGE